MNITDQFIDNLYTFSKREFTDKEVLHAKKCLLDYLGVTLAGAKAYYDVEKAMLETGIADGGKSTVIGHDKKVSAPLAALINGISAHAVELDDGQRFGNVHPGAPIISSLLSVAEYRNLSISDLTIGILTGYECTLRLACSIQPGHKLKGFHATGPCCTIGGAMAIAAMCGYTKKQFKSALSAACTSASGILEMIEGDTQMMPYNSGKAASNAIVAASVGLSGFKCPDDALGGKRGFLNCFAEKPKLNILTDFNDQLYSTSNYFKLYAACGHCHSGIDAALKLRSQNHFLVEEIDHIVVETYKLAIQGHDHNIIDGINSAKMSIPYSVAVALFKGSAGINDYDEDSITNRSILNLTSKITVRENEEITRLAPQKRISVVHVYTKDEHYLERVDYPKGQPENPLSTIEIEDKFYSMCHYASFSMDKAKMLANIVLNDGINLSVRDLLKEL